MTADANVLDAIELGSLLMPITPPKARMLDIPGIVARDTEQASPFFNLVANARLDDATADLTIARVLEHFRCVARPVGWVVGPRSTPAHLDARLGARGFAPLGSAVGFMLSDLSVPIAAPEIAVREIRSGADLAEVDRVKSEIFHFPVETARWIDEQIVSGNGKGARLYAAFVEDRAVGFAQTYFHLDVALLSGAGVVEDARRRGVYRALARRRIEDARAMGMRCVAIQAIGETAAAAATKLGFQRV